MAGYKIEAGVDAQWVHFHHWRKSGLDDIIGRFINQERPKSMSPVEDGLVPTFTHKEWHIVYFFER